MVVVQNSAQPYHSRRNSSSHALRHPLGDVLYNSLVDIAGLIILSRRGLPLSTDKEMVKIAIHFQLSMLASLQTRLPFREIVFERDLIIPRTLQHKHRPALASTSLNGREIGEIAPVRRADAEGQFGVRCG